MKMNANRVKLRVVQPPRFSARQVFFLLLYREKHFTPSTKYIKFHCKGLRFQLYNFNVSRKTLNLFCFKKLAV